MFLALKGMRGENQTILFLMNTQVADDHTRVSGRLPLPPEPEGKKHPFGRKIKKYGPGGI